MSGRPGSRLPAASATSYLKRAFEEKLATPTGEIPGWQVWAEQIRELVLNSRFHLLDGQLVVVDERVRERWAQWISVRVDGLPKTIASIELPGAELPKFVAVGIAQVGHPLVDEEAEATSAASTDSPVVRLQTHEEFLVEAAVQEAKRNASLLEILARAH